jgi:ParB family chromosome partitioning protein
VTAANPEALARQVIERGLSVRQTEALAREIVRPEAPARQAPVKDADTRALEADLTANLRLKVMIDHKQGGQSGEVRIHYTTLEELDGLCQLLVQ